MQRLVKVLIVALFLVICFEIGYYFLLATNKNDLQITTAPTSTQELPISTPVPSYTPALNISTLQFLMKTNAVGHKSSMITQQFEGKIHRISKDRYNSPEGIHEMYSIYLTDDSSSDETTMNLFYITKTTEQIMNIYQDNPSNPVKIEELKAGDIITINLTMDLTKDPGKNFTQFDIIRHQ